jgi:hypothetical protein
MSLQISDNFPHERKKTPKNITGLAAKMNGTWAFCKTSVTRKGLTCTSQRLNSSIQI